MKTPFDNEEEQRRKVLGLGDSSVHKTHYPSLRRRLLELERLRLELERSEAYLSEAQRLSHTGSFGWIVSSGEMYWSQETFQIFEYTRETTPTIERVLQRTHPEDRALVRQVIDRASQEGSDLDFEHRLSMPDGSVKYVRVVGRPSMSDLADFEFVGAVTDITATKRAEEERRQSAERFRAIADYTYDWEYWIGIDGKLLWVNPAVERITGYSVGECMAMPDFPVAIVAEADREPVARQIREAVQGSSRNDFEFRVCHKDGHLAWVAASWQPIYDSRGARLGHRSSIRDITERKRAEEALQRLLAELESRVKERTKEVSEANESLQAANKELESFSYSVSHDLRAPLRAIDGFSKMVLNDYAEKLGDEGRRKLNVIHSNTRRMAELIDDLLAFSRMGRKEMLETRIDMDSLVRRTWSELNLVTPERRIQFSVDTLPPAMGDQALIKEVVVNLLSNAMKFSKSRETATVEVGAYPEGERNVYFVKDNGVGFDMQYYDKLFGVFQRLHTADEFEGTGVGLAIVQRIIARHGGRVWAEGNVGEGATFYFTLAKKD